MGRSPAECRDSRKSKELSHGRCHTRVMFRLLAVDAALAGIMLAVGAASAQTPVLPDDAIIASFRPR